jgi:hypothetical protein
MLSHCCFKKGACVAPFFMDEFFMVVLLQTHAHNSLLIIEKYGETFVFSPIFMGAFHRAHVKVVSNET